MFQIFVITVQGRNTRAWRLSIVSILRSVLLERVTLVLQESPGNGVRSRLFVKNLAMSSVFLQAHSSRLAVLVLLALRLAFMLHAPVLKPDFYLPLREVQQGGDLNPPWSAQVLVEVEFFLKFQQLCVSVGRSQSACAAATSATIRNLRRTCTRNATLYIINMPLITTRPLLTTSSRAIQLTSQNLSNILRFARGINRRWE